MTSLDQLREDLDYVAGAVRRDRKRPIPYINLLWAVLIPVGFALSDFAPRQSGLYWMIAAPGGVLLSFWLARSAARRQGARDLALVRRTALHWFTLLAAFFVYGAAVASGHIEPRTSFPNWLLIAALGHLFAGIHLNRGLLWSGLVLFAGYIALVWLPLPYIWTSTGLIVAAALVIAAWRDQAVCAGA
jgi:hypothetical protein